MLFLFFTELGKSLEAKQAIFAGQISSIGLAGVGVFPAPVVPLHTIAGFVFFVPAAIAAIIITRKLMQNSKIVAAAALQVISLALFGLFFTGLFQLLCVLAYAAWIVSVAYSD